MTKLIIMTQKELSRYEVIKRLIRKEINGTEAAKQMNLSVRQVKNIKAEVIKEGEKGIIHKSRGKIGNRKLSSEIIKKAKYWLKKRYYDFKPTFAMEKLEENHQIKLSKEKVRQTMTEISLWRPKQRKKNKGYRSWRKRKDYYGEMEQFDGCYFDWLETGEIICLLASRDDANNNITGLMFTGSEAFNSVAEFWEEYFKSNGKPLKIYLDKFSTYKNNHKSVVDDPKVLTQFQRAMRQLDVETISAHSPEAKGRIENVFPTLQHRLVRELRLAGISDIKDANKFAKDVFIDKFNDRFSVVPEKRGDVHRKLTDVEKDKLKQILSKHQEKIVHNDFTISYRGKWFQLERQQPVLVRKKEKVMVEERTTGKIFISLRGKYLDYFVLPSRPKKIKDVKIAALATSKPNWKPPADHPWRRPFILESQKRSKHHSRTGTNS